MESETGLSESTVDRFRSNFEAEPRFGLAQNVCTKHGPLEVLRKRKAEETLSHVFTHKIDAEGKPVTNQKASGRCWIYALLNCMRLPFVKSLNLEDFEFSQSYIFFWDKLERFNYVLHAIVETARNGEPADGRLVSHLLHNPSEDGGQWAMLVNLVNKYGVMPKKCFPCSWTSENSRQMKDITNNKIREYCWRLRGLVEEKKTDEELQKVIDGMNEELYRIVSICLGTPPKEFVWEYYDKEKAYHKIGPISPLEFYKQHVKSIYNVDDKVCFVNDPRPQNDFDNLYTVEYLGNMQGGLPVLYINKPVDFLKKSAAESIKNNEAVWFGCDVGKHCSWRKHGFEDLTGYDYELVFGTSVLNLSKADRLIYGESLMTHAMVLTAVSLDGEQTTKWRIENSWGEEGGEKGYMTMTDNWFSQFVYEVVVDKKYVPEETLKILEKQPRVLPAWDPMGALA